MNRHTPTFRRCAAAGLVAAAAITALAGCESLGGDDPTQRGLVKKGDGRGVSEPYIVRDSGAKGSGQPSAPPGR